MVKEDNSLMNFYQEQMIQFGFIAMFANTFPLAPIFSFLTNLIEIRNKLDQLFSYSRKRDCSGASGIDVWLPILEFISIICIPINTGIIYFTGDGNLFQSGKSSYIKFLEGRDITKWNALNIIVLTIGIEHLILLLKVLINVLISDVPKCVIEAEKKRPFIYSRA